MADPMFVTLQQWLASPSPSTSRWRRRARQVMREAVEILIKDLGKSPTDRDQLLAAVDRVYPFGPREHHPYKAWLAERRLLIAALTSRSDLPTVEDLAACQVAHDAVIEGRVNEARMVLDDMAPRRLGRACGACGARAGRPCRAIAEDFEIAQTIRPNSPGEARRRRHARLELLVPHLVRVTPPAQPSSGPLFEDSTHG